MSIYTPVHPNFTIYKRGYKAVYITQTYFPGDMDNGCPWFLLFN